MSASLSLKEAELGLAARLIGHAPLTAIVPEEHILEGWPTEVLAQPSPALFPRIGLLRVTDEIVRPGVGLVHMQVTIWVWEGKATIDAIDELVLGLLDEQQWTYDDGAGNVAELNAIALPGPVPRLGRPRSWTRDYEIGVS